MKEKVLTPAQIETARLESVKLCYDLFKHCTTLSTGTILILATFLEKIFQNPVWKVLVIISLVSLIISVMFSLLTMYVLALLTSGVANLEDKDESVAVWFIGIALGSFVLGIFSFVIFTLINFYR